MTSPETNLATTEITPFNNWFVSDAAHAPAQPGEPSDLPARLAQRAWLAAKSAVLATQRQGEGEGWQPIETAPKDGRTLLLGYFNSSGKWRTLRGQWFSEAHINENWEEECEEGWYETSVECGDDVNCWKTEPTHFKFLPAAPNATSKD